MMRDVTVLGPFSFSFGCSDPQSSPTEVTTTEYRQTPRTRESDLFLFFWLSMAEEVISNASRYSSALFPQVFNIKHWFLLRLFAISL